MVGASKVSWLMYPYWLLDDASYNHNHLAYQLTTVEGWRSVVGINQCNTNHIFSCWCIPAVTLFVLSSHLNQQLLVFINHHHDIIAATSLAYHLPGNPTRPSPPVPQRWHFSAFATRLFLILLARRARRERHGGNTRPPAALWIKSSCAATVPSWSPWITKQPNHNGSWSARGMTRKIRDRPSLSSNH